MATNPNLMLRFFRQIRQRLLTDNKFSKYLMYAIGEVLLVVVGILIALQVDNWNENRKDDQNLRETLVALKEEVVYNANFLEFLTKERTRKEQEYTNYLDIITDKSKSVAERAQYELPDWFARRQTFNVPISNSLENSGLINRIQNDSLKYLLISIRSSYSNINNWENLYFEQVNRFREYLDTKYPRFVVDSKDHNAWNNYFPNEIGENLSAYRQSYIDDLEYYNFITAVAGNLHVQVIVGHGLLYRFGRILELLEKEISNN